MPFSYFTNHTPKTYRDHQGIWYFNTISLQNNQWHVLFEVRSHTLNSQPGEICFPGGALEDNETYPLCARREASEELGISDRLIEIIGPMDYIITPFKYALYPYVGILHIDNLECLDPNKDEVDHLFTIPLDELMLLEPEKHFISTQVLLSAEFPYHKIQNGKAYSWKFGEHLVLFYETHNRIIWGLTASILKEFIEIMRKNINQTTSI
jgi:peroxisomal coenzyme A diphosphatase NUDT7